jgi:hypothetical protein
MNLDVQENQKNLDKYNERLMVFLAWYAFCLFNMNEYDTQT